MKKYTGLALVAALWLGLAAFAWLSPARAVSDAERRPLAQFPGLTAQEVLSGGFSSDFADYAVDQFPLRDSFRSLKAALSYYVFCQKDNNGIYLTGSTAAKMEYPLNEASLRNAAGRFNALYETYLKDAAKVHFAVIPDKGYYLAEQTGHLTLDQQVLTQTLKQALPWAQFFSLEDSLTADSYYPTDTHWRQEALTPVLERIREVLGLEGSVSFTSNTLPEPFYGVYLGQAALPLEPDRITYLTWEGWEDCTVWSLDTGKTTPIYDPEKRTSADLYDFFLSGGMALQVIENPHAEGELIVFRDSFGSSLVPLLVPHFGKITLIDTRYIHPALLESYVNFEGKQVLMLYSTLLLNSSGALRK